MYSKNLDATTKIKIVKYFCKTQFRYALDISQGHLLFSRGKGNMYPVESRENLMKIY